MPFVITFDGRSFNTDDLTIDEVAVVERETNLSWLVVNPAETAMGWRAIVKAFLCREESAETVAKRLAKVKVKEAMNTVKWVEDDLPDVYEDGIPKAETAAPSIDGSSGPTDDSAGPRVSQDSRHSVTSSS